MQLHKNDSGHRAFKVIPPNLRAEARVIEDDFGWIAYEAIRIRDMEDFLEAISILKPEMRWSVLERYLRERNAFICDSDGNTAQDKTNH